MAVMGDRRGTRSGHQATDATRSRAIRMRLRNQVREMDQLSAVARIRTLMQLTRWLHRPYLRLSITYQSGMADDQGVCEV